MTPAPQTAQSPTHSPTSDRPTVFVMYGATGDLSRRLVSPAFFELARLGRLPAQWRLIGSGRGSKSHEEFRDFIREALEEFGPQPADGPWEEFAANLLFAGGGFTADDPGELLDVLAAAKQDLGDDVEVVHYLAIPPGAFLDTTKAFATHGLAEGSRVVYEKPYGTSLETFEELDAEVQRVFDESQVFRIDHFLAFEAQQDVIHARFANPWLASIWNREFVAQVQVDIAETLDVAQRASFYDATGAFLDMIVTHLFQMAATVAMEPPADLGPGALQAARDAALQDFRELDPAEVVLGQFDGYTAIDGVPDDSRTDTLAACRVWIDNDRWRGVPFLLRSGKKMTADEQRVTLVLKSPADLGQSLHADAEPATISFSLLEGGALDVATTVRKPGVAGGLVQGTASLPLDGFEGPAPALPYVHLIEHVLTGDRSLFTGVEGLRAAWTAIDRFSQNRPEVLPYAPGTWGPQAADALAEPGQWFLR
ncbi:glucose-6-phosphate dehydrogenase [Kineococcus rhizosphaerae]|uniref:Glucose-6-phosphate 1-dehydrogenase n=1 Tax=Kineococcus rhizosphaerae TaxID=559628 RepID=A0A2T0R434_9ACTN|nr:glucose-6-phosphate dehydrogenase (NADP(+)) [Kineococcus rhizosphaerae]PRY15104.1 glucose-6-phosphate 1-dehydrogenase [Kineococcus rhizosphaerae]